MSARYLCVESWAIVADEGELLRPGWPAGAAARRGRCPRVWIPLNRGVGVNVTVVVRIWGVWERSTWAIAVDLGVARADAAAAPKTMMVKF